MKLICYLFGHRAIWSLNRSSGMLLPKCRRCRRNIMASNCAHLDPFYL